jgi:hypothetical protein
MLIYGIALNVASVDELEEYLSDEWVLRLYFSDQEHLNEAQKVFSQMMDMVKRILAIKKKII